MITMIDNQSLLQQAKSIIANNKWGCNSEDVLLIPSHQAKHPNQAPKKMMGENKSQQANYVNMLFKLQVH
jgi:hypothetical protein